jgi:hypothetical protein
MTKQKKPKTGDVVGWGVIDCDGDIRSHCDVKTRDEARKRKAELYDNGDEYSPFHIVKIVLA